MSRERKMVYERGRLVPAEHSERMRKAQAEQSFVQGALAGVLVGGSSVAVGFVVAPWWGLAIWIIALLAWALKDGGGGETVPQAGSSNMGGTG